MMEKRLYFPLIEIMEELEKQMFQNLIIVLMRLKDIVIEYKMRLNCYK